MKTNNILESNKSVIKKKKCLSNRDIQLYLMCFIPILLIFIFCYLPMGGIIIAFKDYKFSEGIFGSKWVGFQNFKFFFSTSEFIRITWNTLFMNFLFFVTSTLAAVVAAILMFEITSRKAIKIFQTIFITPYFISFVIVSYMVYAFLNPRYGLINTILHNIGFSAVDWYASPRYWPLILILVNIWKGIGISCIYYYASLMSIDSTLFEAAEIDGANKFQMTWHITLPSLVPIVAIFGIMAVGNIFRADFGMFYQVPRNVPVLYPTTDVVDTYIFRALREIGDMGIGSAVGLLQSFVGLVLVMAINQIVKKLDDNLALF